LSAFTHAEERGGRRRRAARTSTQGTKRARLSGDRSLCLYTRSAAVFHSFAVAQRGGVQPARAAPNTLPFVEQIEGSSTIRSTFRAPTRSL